jgi:cardiolipin synthase
MGLNRSPHRLTLPNVLTTSRIAAAPFLAAAVLVTDMPIAASGIVIFAALTDMLDGSLARAMNQASTVGVILDPIADKIFMLTAFFLLCADGTLRGIALWPALIIIWRELLISGLREYRSGIGLRISVSRSAKLKTAIQFSSVISLFLARVPSQASEIFLESGTFLLWAAAALTLYTGADYAWQAWRQSWK